MNDLSQYALQERRLPGWLGQNFHAVDMEKAFAERVRGWLAHLDLDQWVSGLDRVGIPQAWETSDWQIEFNGGHSRFDKRGSRQLESGRESLPIEGVRLHLLKWLNKKPYLANGSHCLPGETDFGK